jgi:cytoskeletal protein RodZ
MPDFFNSHRLDDAPQGWGEAFAALPLETPPGDGWSGLARALDARTPHIRAARRERRTNWLIGMASAAVLALAVWAPLAQWLQPPAQGGSNAVAAADSSKPAVNTVATKSSESVSQVNEASRDAPASNQIAIASAVTPMAMNRPRSRIDRERSRRATDRLIASLPALGSTDAASLATTVSPNAGDSMQELQTQSAQLEALIALARDERVGSASSAVLTSELDARIAEIDDALSQIDVGSEQRTGLWQQRVETLQQLASIKSTERWLAAHGALYNAALVSVD